LVAKQFAKQKEKAKQKKKKGKGKKRALCTWPSRSNSAAQPTKPRFFFLLLTESSVAARAAAMPWILHASAILDASAMDKDPVAPWRNPNPFPPSPRSLSSPHRTAELPSPWPMPLPRPLSAPRHEKLSRRTAVVVHVTYATGPRPRSTTNDACNRPIFGIRRNTTVDPPPPALPRTHRAYHVL
jgi:hypothetical protein